MENLTQSITAKVIALAIIVIVIVSVAIPVIQDANKTVYATDNNDSYTYRAVDANSGTLVYEVISTTEITVNGVSMPFANSRTIFIDENIVINSTGGTFLVYDMASGTQTYATSGAKLTLTAGTYNIDTSTPITGTITGYALGVAPTGDYGSYYSGAEIRINLDSDIQGSFSATLVNVEDSTDTMSVGGIISGNSVDGLVCTTVADRTNHVALDLDDVTLQYTFPESENGINYALTMPIVIGISYTDSDSGKTYAKSDISVSNIFAPIKYNTESEMNALIAIIPILLILVPVMLSVRMIASSRS